MLTMRFVVIRIESLLGNILPIALLLIFLKK